VEPIKLLKSISVAALGLLDGFRFDESRSGLLAS
jgi:hypothetical protein